MAHCDRSLWTSLVSFVEKSKNKDGSQKNLPPYNVHTEIDWTYPNIILYLVENGVEEKDSTAVQEILSRLDIGSGAVTFPGNLTMIPMDRYPIQMALSSMLFEANRQVGEIPEDFDEDGYEDNIEVGHEGFTEDRRNSSRDIDLAELEYYEKIHQKSKNVLENQK